MFFPKIIDPIDLSHLSRGNNKGGSPFKPTTSTTSEPLLVNVGGQSPNTQNTGGKNKEETMFDSTIGIVISTIAAVTLVLFIVALIIFKRSKTRRDRNNSSSSVEVGRPYH